MNASSAPSQRTTDGVAIASLVLSRMSIIAGPFGFIPGIICGHVAHSRMRRDPALDGRGLATAGLIVGYTWLVLLAAMVAFVLLIARTQAPVDFLPGGGTYEAEDALREVREKVQSKQK